MTTKRPSFGPSAIVTPANALTLGRLLAAPVLAVLTIAIGPTSWVLWALWIVLRPFRQPRRDTSPGATGRHVRARSSTRSPTRLLVLGALSALAAFGTISVAAGASDRGREIAMSGFRVVSRAAAASRSRLVRSPS